MLGKATLALTAAAATGITIGGLALALGSARYWLAGVTAFAAALTVAAVAFAL